MASIAWLGCRPARLATGRDARPHRHRAPGRVSRLAAKAESHAWAGTRADRGDGPKRRPRGTLAAPERRAGDRLPRSVVVTLVLLGLLLPLLGARYAAARFRGFGRPTA